MFKAIEPIYGHHIRKEESNISCCIPNCEKEALAVAAAMEKGTTHPIGRYHFEQNVLLLLNTPIKSYKHWPSMVLCIILLFLEEKQ